MATGLVGGLVTYLISARHRRRGGGQRDVANVVVCRWRRCHGLDAVNAVDLDEILAFGSDWLASDQFQLAGLLRDLLVAPAISSVNGARALSRF
ncbi:hypothetical protein [Mycolicibacterium chlorophenolicum]|uniref:hypothetical protein n=1 Tax=Mycolicibacterium chlorophenolicum TaxID=37916 RepID=UPI00103B029F|nr:hypothetical protein [Mycolicibacterium chlorophenolicum]